MSNPIESDEIDAIEGVPPPYASSGLVGHTQVWDRLIRQVQTDRLPNAILLHGPRGIGKATLAFELAVQILTQTGDEPEERVRSQVQQNVHPNLFTLRRRKKEGASNPKFIPVDEVRTLVSRMHMTRGREGHRVCIVDAAEDCNAQAANAMLKTLEEPPAQSHFILVSHRPGSLLPTIRSRCQMQAMRELSEADMQEMVAHMTATMPELTLSSEVIAIAHGVPRTLFELDRVADHSGVQALDNWLQHDCRIDQAQHLAIAQSLAGAGAGPVYEFAKTRLFDWIAGVARRTAIEHPHDNKRLASIHELWNKAGAAFRDAEIYNLDLTQTFISVLEDIGTQQRSANLQEQ